MRTIAHWVDGKYYEGIPIGRFAVENPGTGEVEAELLQASDADIVQEPTDQPYGVRDCAFRDPAGNSIELADPAIWAPKGVPST